MNKFIVLESIEAAGKGTATAYTKSLCALHKIPMTFTREIGGTAYAEAVREIMLNLTQGYTNVASISDLMVAYAARVHHTQNLIIPALEKGHVFSERYYASTLAYQAVECPETRAVHDLVMPYLRKPDLTILLDIRPETSFARMKETRTDLGIALDKFEQKSLEYFYKVRANYQAQLDDTWILVDAERPLAQVKEQISAIILEATK